jgi:GNAT superfamily N-acetyltransferase
MLIRTLTVDDIPFGLRLTAQNGWNQLEADWRRQLELQPDGGFVAERDGTPVGTACGCIFDDVGWVNLVLVDKPHRGLGIGTLLMAHVIEFLERRGVASIRLDATPLGQPVYEKLGFAGDFTLTRYEGTLSSPAQASLGVEPMTQDDLPAACQMDAAISHTRRDRLLRSLFEAAPHAARKCVRNGELKGYCLARPGARAWQLGPLQGSEDAGRALVLDAALRFAGQRIYIDVPDDHGAAIALVQSLGLTPQRSFLRMTLGRRVLEDIIRFWSSFGPEKG